MSKFIVEKPDGSTITLDDESTAKLAAIAKRLGISMEAAFKQVLLEGFKDMADEVADRIANPEVGKA